MSIPTRSPSTVNLYRILLAALLLPAAASVLRAQHCGYDFAQAIVVEPRDAATGRAIAGLRLTLLDSLGAPVGEAEEDRLFLDAVSGTVPSRGGAHWSRWIYNDLWFTRGAYVLVIGHRHQQLRVRIEDMDRRSDDGVFYDPVTIQLGEEDVQPLCTNLSDWRAGERSQFARTFQPVAVTLVRRDVQ